LVRVHSIQELVAGAATDRAVACRPRIRLHVGYLHRDTHHSRASPAPRAHRQLHRPPGPNRLTRNNAALRLPGPRDASHVRGRGRPTARWVRRPFIPRRCRARPSCSRGICAAPARATPRRRNFIASS
jgi:hypothetical protein